ncbi:MAG: hypothetical protein COT81_04425 [Candidatus Buchananbacteria bacterium CG10_big_fil_rev_8_21_14_0_10_42_9]|uniref:Uncharacterized protein n=1 Tax=Candidatus Buchananbacteria bacterium CG10_big_fil_rev_8_21_14_0_10_42_9 TaxID=1974526 RepID=A0A2H0W0I9_9BACT|nr:MAG: hypothetical protein COT81_04425 [Candidatus Buchananbacteria bacterium CG10_big_fil_rev_8_21_14_0_10_42_9]
MKKLIIIASLIAIITPATASASVWTDVFGDSSNKGKGLIGAIDCGADNDCDLNDALELIYVVSSLILGIVGSLALLMFVYGGVMYIMAAGNDEQIKKGTDVLKNASIGIIIVLLAWSLVNFTILAFTGGEFGKPATIFEGSNPTPFNQPGG